MTQSDVTIRYDAAISIAETAAATALEHFRNHDQLAIEVKGEQDWVSNADRDVETQIRSALSELFPKDGVIGEEHGRIESQSGYTWIIDPIDGTTNFVNSLPGWCVVIACVHANVTVLGVICDPISEETYSVCCGQATTLNGKNVSAASAQSLTSGSIAVGHSMRVPPAGTLAVLHSLLAKGGMFYRNGSGALMLAYVAAGRLLGYCEPHMNSWDCLAGLMMIESAGGKVRPFNSNKMLATGERVVAGGPGIYSEFLTITNDAYG